MGKTKRMVRDVMAVLVCIVYVIPILWWIVSSFTPTDALLDIDRMLALDFKPTLSNFAVAVFGEAETIFDSRQSLVDSVVVALLSTAIGLLAAIPAAYGLSLCAHRSRKIAFALLVLQRVLPPVAVVFPLVVIYHAAGLIDSRFGLALAHAGLNLPVSVLLLHSFANDIPQEVSEAAMLDGASAMQRLWRVIIPLLKGGIAATAIMCFLFSWTEFMISLFLTQNLRLVPVQAQVLNMNMWGLVSAMTTAALIPAFLVIAFAQRQIVRGLTFGLIRS
jgi:multiple sugar transport system permease protein